MGDDDNTSYRTSQHRLDKLKAPTLQPWRHSVRDQGADVPANVVVNCGWGRIIFGHTFSSCEELVRATLQEDEHRRDVALYVPDPHVVVSLAPQQLFLDPSHSYRLYFEDYRPEGHEARSFIIRKLQTREDAEAVNEVYARRHMVTFDPSFIFQARTRPDITYLVAEDKATGQIIGTLTGVDHVEAFNDPERGSSMWALAVDPQTSHPGVGRALVVHLIEHFVTRGRSYLDLSVMYDNTQAIRLYESLGFSRVPVFVVKNKNPINENLYLGHDPAGQLNPYARVITREARRRGISVDVVDSEAAYFNLSYGGRTIVCRESLSEMTSAIAMSRCDDKRVTHRCLTGAGLKMPAQLQTDVREARLEFLRRFEKIVVKPAHGEQGRGVSIGIGDPAALDEAVTRAEAGGSVALLEEMVHGQDLRIIVIDYRVVAAAVRSPPSIVGDGHHTVAQLIEKQSRRRAAATGGESRIPIDAETRRTLREAGCDLDDVLPPRKHVQVRKAANLHTGGTIHDVTDELHPALVQVAKRAAEVLDIPVVGFDLMVPSIREPTYYIIEANERPGLANHEPQPTAARFIDLLFPQTVS